MSYGWNPSTTLCVLDKNRKRDVRKFVQTYGAACTKYYVFGPLAGDIKWGKINFIYALTCEFLLRGLISHAQLWALLFLQNLFCWVLLYHLSKWNTWICKLRLSKTDTRDQWPIVVSDWVGNRWGIYLLSAVEPWQAKAHTTKALTRPLSYNFCTCQYIFSSICLNCWHIITLHIYAD